MHVKNNIMKPNELSHIKKQLELKIQSKETNIQKLKEMNPEVD